MINFTLIKDDKSGLYFVLENGIKVKNPIFKDKHDFELELKAINFNKPHTITVKKLYEFL